MAVAHVDPGLDEPEHIPYQQHCSNCGSTTHRKNRCPEEPRAKLPPKRILPPRTSKVETEVMMLRELAAEIGVRTGAGSECLVETRRRLPVVRDTDTIRRPRWRSECVPCPTCQAWRDAGAGAFDGRLPCTHNFDEAIAHSRPCVFALCRSNLFTEIKPRIGSLILVFGDDDPTSVAGESCEKDVSARGGATLDEVGRVVGCTRERVHQVEEIALRKMAQATGYELGLPPGR